MYNMIHDTENIIEFPAIYSTSIGHVACANALKHGTITVSGFGYFHKNCRFLWEKNVSKTNLGSTIHYTYMSYNKIYPTLYGFRGVEAQ